MNAVQNDMCQVIYLSLMYMSNREFLYSESMLDAFSAIFCFLILVDGQDFKDYFLVCSSSSQLASWKQVVIIEAISAH